MQEEEAINIKHRKAAIELQKNVANIKKAGISGIDNALSEVGAYFKNPKDAAASTELLNRLVAATIRNDEDAIKSIKGDISELIDKTDPEKQ